MHQRVMSELYNMYCDMVASHAPEYRRFSALEQGYLSDIAKLVNGQVASASVVSQPYLVQSAVQAFPHTAVLKRKQQHAASIRDLWLVYWHPDECYAVIANGIKVVLVQLFLQP